jgi:nicotinate phosphoribosyltransferase
MLDLSIRTRRLLDEAGLQSVGIFASSSLDEDGIARLIGAGAPIDGFGVGTEMGVAPDAPMLDMAYKLVEYAGRGRIKLSMGKSLLPGPKQICRVERDGVALYDVIARRDGDEAVCGRPLLQKVMNKGTRAPEGRVALDDARTLRAAELHRLPASLRAISPADPPFTVNVSARLSVETERLRQYHERASAPTRPARMRST